MYKVIEVKPLSNFRIWVKFEDGTEGTVDLSDLVNKGVFQRLREKEYFESVYVDPETHTVAWPDGLDLCPDALYSEITGKEMFLIFKAIHSAK